MFFPEDSVSISGEVKYFESKGSSGKMVKRGFCPTCGSQMFGIPEVMPDMLAIRAGSLENLSDYEPQMDIYTSHSTVWDVMAEGLPKFPEMPPQD